MQKSWAGDLGAEFIKGIEVGGVTGVWFWGMCEVREKLRRNVAVRPWNRIKPDRQKASVRQDGSQGPRSPTEHVPHARHSSELPV